MVRQPAKKLLRRVDTGQTFGTGFTCSSFRAVDHNVLDPDLISRGRICHLIEVLDLERPLFALA